MLLAGACQCCGHLTYLHEPLPCTWDAYSAAAAAAGAAAAEISNDLLDVYVTVLAKDSMPGTPPGAQPSSPDDATHLQLQENRVRLVMQQQQQHAPQQQRQRSSGPAAPSEEQQQGDEQQQQPNGNLQHYPS
jgi:hypothetical protein